LARPHQLHRPVRPALAPLHPAASDSECRVWPDVAIRRWGWSDAG
jgi:hypothetical protein